MKYCHCCIADHAYCYWYSNDVAVHAVRICYYETVESPTLSVGTAALIFIDKNYLYRANQLVLSHWLGRNFKNFGPRFKYKRNFMLSLTDCNLQARLLGGISVEIRDEKWPVFFYLPNADVISTNTHHLSLFVVLLSFQNSHCSYWSQERGQEDSVRVLPLLGEYLLVHSYVSVRQRNLISKCLLVRTFNFLNPYV